MKRIVLVHHHIFKNAGTSFNHALEKAFSDGFLEYDLPGSRVVTTEQLGTFLLEHPQAEAVSGHHICLPTPQSESFQTVSTVLIRNPLARIRSIYEFERKQTAETDGAVMAKKLDFKDFVSWRLQTSPNVFCNYQTLYCSRTTNLNAKYLPTEEDFSLAIQNLEKCLAVGTVERYSEFLMMAQYELDRYYSGITLRNLHLNVTTKPVSSQKRPSLEETLVQELGKDLVSQIVAMNQLDQQLYQFAERCLDEWLAKEVDAKAEYFERMGNTLLANRSFQEAKVSFQAATSLNPYWFKSYYGLATALTKLGDVDRAIEYYREAIELKPNFAWSYFELGNIFYQQAIFDEAAEYYRKAIEVHPFEKSFMLYLKLGDALMQQHKFEGAIQNYQIADEIELNSVDCKYRLGLAYSQNRQLERAIDSYHQALQLNSKSYEICLALGDAYFNKGQFEFALSSYRRGLEMSSGSALDATRYMQRIQECQSFSEGRRAL